jgi:mannose-6-phosphate isomerase-like protein (cupin superfamily)
MCASQLNAGVEPTGGAMSEEREDDGGTSQGKILVLKAAPDGWKEERHWWGGAGKVLLRLSPVGGVLDESPEAHLGEIVMAPGAYVGYHVHEGWREILHIVSGHAEHFEDGRVSALEPGDTVVVGTSGGAHALRNSGTTDLKVLGWYTLPKGATGNVAAAPLPAAIAHWASS